MISCSYMSFIGWLLICWFMTKLLNLESTSTLNLSFIMQRTSKRDNIGSLKFVLSLKLFPSIYRPFIGFAAAITLHLAFKLVTIPAFDIEIVCCYIASWIEVLSISFILSNSSIKHIPLSASTKAPAYNLH